MALQAILFIHAARATREDFVEAEQKTRSTRIYFFVIVIPAILLLSGLFIPSLLRAWQTAIWEPAIIVGAVFTGAIFVFMRAVRRLRYPRQAELEDMRMIRQAIASVGASSSSSATDDDNTISSAASKDSASPFRVLSFRVSSDRALALWLFGRGVSIIFLSIVVAGVFLLVLNLLLIVGPSSEFLQTALRAGVGPILLSLLLVALLFLLDSRIDLPSVGVSRAISEANHLLKGATAEVDGAGIRWTGGSRGKRSFWVAWSDVTSVFVVRVTNHVGHDSNVYVLSTPAANLVWEPSAKANDQQDHERFISYVLARTGLSLRQLSLTEPAPQQMDALRSPAQNHPEQMISSTLSRVIERARRARRTGVRNAWLAVTLGSLLFIGGPWSAQIAQAREYEDLMAVVTVQSPAYQASLSQPSSDWPALKADSTGRARTYYEDGMLHLTGASQAGKPGIVWAHMQNDYQDAAVAVTARQLADAPTRPVGLLLRYTAAPERFIALVFASNGDWALITYDSSAPSGLPGKRLLSGVFSNTPIHTGLGASNKLLVVMRGDEYACYINGRFVGKAFDNLIESGSPGVVNYDSSTVAAFSDFAVYPV